MDNGIVYKFNIEVNRVFDKNLDNLKHPAWTKLDFHKCENCLLTNKEYLHCPIALDIKDVIVKFNSILSFESVNVRVKTPERFYFKRCDVQTGLRSLLGLIMATSACPILSSLRGMAYYHLPFAAPEETLFRTTGAYLLKQYFAFKKGATPDLELAGLSNLYEQLQVLNRCFGERIRAASQKDANMNAIDKLFSLSAIVSFHIDEKLEELRPLFEPF